MVTRVDFMVFSLLKAFIKLVHVYITRLTHVPFIRVFQIIRIVCIRKYIKALGPEETIFLFPIDSGLRAVSIFKSTHKSLFHIHHITRLQKEAEFN